MNKEPRDQRLIVPFTETEVENIEAWWHENRLPSRAEAIRELIRRGLDYSEPLTTDTNQIINDPSIIRTEISAEDMSGDTVTVGPKEP